MPQESQALYEARLRIIVVHEFGFSLAALMAGSAPPPSVLHSSDARYAWVNALPIWGHGTIDLTRGELVVTGFTIPSP
jgi:hypothetical protein